MSAALTQRAVAVAFTENASGDETVAQCAPGESMLLAGLRAGLALPYECASGGCGSCRAQLLAGAVTSRWPAASGLSERDRRRGDRILLCQSLPDVDCRVRVTVPDVAVAPGTPAPPVPARRTATLTRRVMLSPDTAELVLDTGEPTPYLPGQFVIVEFADGVRRAYSMSRPPATAQGSELDLLVRVKPGGAASGWIFDRLAAGDRVVVEGPYGRAHAQSPAQRPVVCLAGGTGLAPILAIAEHLVAEAPGRPLDVYVGARRHQDVVLAERLHALAVAGTRVVIVVEEPAARHPVLGETRAGFALTHLADDVPELDGHDLYLAGPTPMIDAGLRRLVRDGTARADRVFFDRFIA